MAVGSLVYCLLTAATTLELSHSNSTLLPACQLFTPDSATQNYGNQFFYHDVVLGPFWWPAPLQPLALPKGTTPPEGPLTTLPFLGIVLDTSRMEARLPEEKLLKLRKEIVDWIGYTNATKREILSLVGSLQHAAKVVRCGRAFVSRMYVTAAKVRELHFYTRLNVEFRSDLCWWHTFLTDWNGLSLLRWNDNNWSPSHIIQTDASGSYFFQSQWDTKVITGLNDCI